MWQAFELEGGHYGYCLGVALNHQDRFEESLPILLNQAKAFQPDAMSWFQVSVACAGLGKRAEAVSALERAVELDPDFAIAKFDLGGAYWNVGEHDKALSIWEYACARFPDDEHVDKVLAFLQQ